MAAYTLYTLLLTFLSFYALQNSNHITSRAQKLKLIAANMH